MNTLWDILPREIQEYIQDLSSTSLIKETFKKNREWYFLRTNSIKKLRPTYDGKGYRVGDRVLILQKNNKLSYGTISSISYIFHYHCRVDLLNGDKLYYRPDKKKCEKKDHENILKIILLESWNCCMCHVGKECRVNKSDFRCNYCIFNSN